jgi:hypothetical protein
MRFGKLVYERTQGCSKKWVQKYGEGIVDPTLVDVYERRSQGIAELHDEGVIRSRKRPTEAPHGAGNATMVGMEQWQPDGRRVVHRAMCGDYAYLVPQPVKSASLGGNQALHPADLWRSSEMDDSDAHAYYYGLYVAGSPSVVRGG